MGVEERMERRKGWEEEGIGRRKGWGGGRDWKEEGIGRKRRDGRLVDGRRVDGIWEDGIVMASALILGVRVDPWSASRIAAVFVDLRRRRVAC